MDGIGHLLIFFFNFK